MSTFPWLTVIGAIPLVGAVVVALTPGQSAPGGAEDRSARARLVKQLTLGFTLTTLAVTIAMALRFKPGGPTFQFTQTYQWIPQFGVHYAVGADGIALVPIVMTAILMPVVVLASWNDAEGESSPAGEPPPRRSVKTYFSLMLVLETMMIGLYVYSIHPGHPGTFLFSQLVHVSLSPATQKWLFLGFFVAFAIKAPLWPFHTWLPDAATAAQPGAAVLLVGVLDKVGTFG